MTRIKYLTGIFPAIAYGHVDSRSVFSEMQIAPLPIEVNGKVNVVENDSSWLHIDLTYREMRMERLRRSQMWAEIEIQAQGLTMQRNRRKYIQLRSLYIQNKYICMRYSRTNSQQLQSNGHNSVSGWEVSKGENQKSCDRQLLTTALVIYTELILFVH
jgi:hypothetical protein